jgi:hypothetical protein
MTIVSLQNIFKQFFIDNTYLHNNQKNRLKAKNGSTLLINLWKYLCSGALILLKFSKS